MTRVRTSQTGLTEQGASPEESEYRRPAALAEAIAYHLRLAQEASFQAFKLRVGNADLRPGRYTILSIIAENPGLTPTELSRACGRDKSTLTPTLKDLAKRGLVERKRRESDERSYTVHLTSTGGELLQTLRRHALAHDQTLDRIVGLAKRAEFLEVLRRIADELSEAEPGRARPAGSVSPREKGRRDQADT
jgi:DNA-binding MarR family transcriptional regulator